MSTDSLKQQVAKVAVEFVKPLLTDESVVGIGTGTTTNHFIDQLATCGVAFRGAISSSDASSTRLSRHGIAVLEPGKDIHGVVYVDGADEVDSTMALTKGGGGALTREKITTTMCERFLCLVDESKIVDKLGAFPLPIEVIPMAQHQVSDELSALGGEVAAREQFTTDNGNLILDVSGLSIDHPDELEQQLNSIPGVVENGIFARNRPFLTFVAQACGIEVLGQQEELNQHASRLLPLDVCCLTPVIT